MADGTGGRGRTAAGQRVGAGGERELDPAKRRAFFADILRLYADDLPVLPLYFRVDAFVIPRQLTGVTPTGNQSSSTLWIENWRWAD